MLDDTTLPSPLDADRPDGTAARVRPRPDVVLRFLAEDVADRIWYAGLDFLRVDGGRTEEIIPRVTLNKAQAVVDELTKRGCRLPPDHQARLALAGKLAASEPERYSQLTGTTGYFGGFRVYVFEDTILGEGSAGWIFRPTARTIAA